MATTPATASIEKQLLVLSGRLRAINQVTEESRNGLDRSIYSIISLLADQGPLRLGQIAAAIRLDPSTVTRQVQAVVRMGLAERELDPIDRRATVLSLSAAGWDAVEQGRENRTAMLDAILARWDPTERQDLQEVLARFNDEVDLWLDEEHQQAG